MMYSECEQIEKRGLNRGDLADHLSVERSSIEGILRRISLEPINSIFPWRRIWRCVHGIEGSLLQTHLETMQARHPDSKNLGAIATLEDALKAPLMTFAEMAISLDEKPDTLTKAIKEGRFVLPFPTINLGPRLRRYRRPEVELWVNDQIYLDLPNATQIPTGDKVLPLPTIEVKEGALTASRSLFGKFSRPSQRV